MNQYYNEEEKSNETNSIRKVRWDKSNLMNTNPSSSA